MMHGCEPVPVPSLLLFVKAPLLLLRDLLDGHDVLCVLLIYKFVNLLLQLVLDLALLVLVVKLFLSLLLFFLFRFVLLNMVEDHNAEGEGVQYVQILVFRKFVVCRELQTRDEVVLLYAVVNKRLVEAKGLAQLVQEFPQLPE